MRVLAHAFGARYDLPIPLSLFLIGGALVVIVSFVLVLGREPRDAVKEEAADGGTWIRGRYPVAGSISVLGLAFLCWCGFVGNQEVAENIFPTVFWVVVWVGVPLSVAIVGDWTQPVNPFAFLAKLADSDRARESLLGGPQPVQWPRAVGWWPAAVLFFAGACSELIFNLTMTIPHVIAATLTGYAVVSLLGGLFFGAPWLRQGEMFSVLYDAWGRLGWFRFGAPGRRGFAGGFDRTFAAVPSRLVFVLLMLFSVNFDGLQSTPQWQNDVLRRLPGSAAVPGTGQHWFQVAAFLSLAVILGLILLAFAQSSARAGAHRTAPRVSLSGLLPSLVPIAFGYLFAHYLSYLVTNGQLLAPLIGNPPGLTSWPIHLPYPFNDKFDPNPHVLPNAFYWYVAVVVIVAVHVAAVVIAHRHLARTGPDPERRQRSEYPWLVAMVGYTCLSLWLLAQPFTEVSSTTSGSAAPVPSHPAVQPWRT